MDSKYIIAPDGNFISGDELRHWGIKGMKWGVRRYQNPDGSLTDKGRKRYLREDGTFNDKGFKKFGSKKAVENANESGGSSKNSTSDMTDEELMKRVIRLRNEDAYNTLSDKLGYGAPKTDMDRKIADMKKQKEYLELQRDIKNLTPKKESKAKKVIEKVFSKVVEPVAMDAGKKWLGQKLAEKLKDSKNGDLSSEGAKKVKETLGKEAEGIEKTVRKSYEKVKSKEAKKEAKRQAKEERRRARRESGVKYGTVEGVGNSSRKENYSSPSSRSNNVVDMKPWPNLNAPMSSLPNNTSSGSSWVSNHRNMPVSQLPSPNIAGYLPAPKDDE